MAKKNSNTKKRKTKSSKSTSNFGKMKNILGKVEVLIILVLLVSFLIWAASKCSSSKRSLQTIEQPENTTTKDTTANASNPTSNAAIGEIDLQKLPQNTPPPPSKIITDSYTTLYVTIEGLKVRKEPKLNSEVIDKLTLHERVKFLNERTDFRQKINIGTEYAYEPWVRIKSKRGHNGWVYGAGVHYDKWDRLKENTTIPREETIENIEDEE